MANTPTAGELLNGFSSWCSDFGGNVKDAFGLLDTGIDGLFDTIGGWYNSLNGVSDANALSASEAQKDRDWQEEMYNTRFQRSVEDMKKAGLNPATLSTGSFSVGSSPSGSTANIKGPTSSIIGDVTKLVSTIAKFVA